MSRQSSCVLLAAMFAGVIGSGFALGRDVFVTVGGGPDPANNQVSLEKNVEFFSRTLTNNYPQPLDHRILFADGDASEPDLQYTDESVEITPAMRWMCRIIGEEYWIGLRYRNHHPIAEENPADKQHFHQLMQQLSSELGAGDRLVMYVTAHGSSAESAEESEYGEFEFGDSTSDHVRDTSIVLWGDEQLRVSEFTDWLDQFSPDVEVIVVMVQCYSGGFAEIVFREANRKFGLSDRPRCGFFSQRHDRASAGCTSAVDESNYQEYSSFFWAALSGRSRDGGQLIDADYDQDGRVSLAEAHAYAMITSETIDVPIRTSDVVLRRFSKIESESKDQETSGLASSLFGNLLGRGKASKPSGQANSLERTAGEVRAMARPDQRQVIAQLSAALEIASDTSVRLLQQKRKRLSGRIDSKYTDLAELSDSEATLIEEIRRSLNRANPEFRDHGFSPIITEWTSNRGDEFVQLIESLEESQALIHVQTKIQTLSDDLEELELREAKLERLLRTLQNVLLEVNLPKVADADTVQRYRKLLELENSNLWP